MRLRRAAPSFSCWPLALVSGAALGIVLWLPACSSGPSPTAGTGGHAAGSGGAPGSGSGGTSSTGSGGASVPPGSGGEGASVGGAGQSGSPPASGSGGTTPGNGTGGAASGGAPSPATGGASSGGGGGGAGGAGGIGGGGGGATATGGAAGAGALMTPVELPGKGSGIGFDDLKYSLVLKKLLVPAGRTGDLDLVDPQTLEITRVSGFTASSTFTLGKHRNGSTSADDGDGKIFAIDNETSTVKVIDPATKMITASAMLTAPPDYVRWVESTRELWVTMPQNPGVTVPTPEIEVLKVPETGAPTHSLNITFPASGPEALYIDNGRKRGYTNNGRGGNTYAVDLMTHMVADTWKNGCSGLTVDLELDETRGFLMVACASGYLSVLNVDDGGKMLGEITTAGRGVDVSAYNPVLHHMYLAGQDSMDLTIVGISAAGKPTVLGTVKTAAGSQMVASDEFGNAWVGDPGGGRLLRIRDTYPATP